MRFGLFGSAQARRGVPDVDSGAGFREFVENNVEAEALGYHSTFIVEHHFTGFGQISATLNLLTWMGAGSAASIRKVAALGFNLLLDQYASIEQIGERIAVFKAEVQARGRVFDPMSVGVTRSINIVTTPADLERAMANRVAGRRRIDRLATRPDGPGSNRAQLSDAEICASALYGTPDEVGRMMQSLRAAGAEYVLLNSAGGRPTLRHFAQELMPAFSDAAPVAAGG